MLKMWAGTPILTWFFCQDGSPSPHSFSGPSDVADGHCRSDNHIRGQFPEAGAAQSAAPEPVAVNQTQMNKILIVDYGMGNLRSVQKAFEKVGAEAHISSDPNRVAEADKLVLPGVGAFRDAIARLNETGLSGPIIEHVKKGKLFLGICLGLQLLFTKGYEDGEYDGLDVFAGDVVRFPPMADLKVPHMGWNQLRVIRPTAIFANLPPEASVYFVHSYHVVPRDRGIVATETDYPTPFVSSVWRDNVFATQFHPEKSQRVGLSILHKFAELR